MGSEGTKAVNHKSRADGSYRPSGDRRGLRPLGFTRAAGRYVFAIEKRVDRPERRLAARVDGGEVQFVCLSATTTECFIELLLALPNYPWQTLHTTEQQSFALAWGSS